MNLPDRSRAVRRVLALALGLYALPVTGCACSSEARAGLVLEVRDSRTGRPLASDAAVTATDGKFVQRLYAPGDDPSALRVVGLWERAGTYRVRVERRGYKPWTKSDVVVSKGFCDHVKTVTLDVRMARM